MKQLKSQVGNIIFGPIRHIIYEWFNRYTHYYNSGYTITRCSQQECFHNPKMIVLKMQKEGIDGYNIFSIAYEMPVRTSYNTDRHKFEIGFIAAQGGGVGILPDGIIMSFLQQQYIMDKVRAVFTHYNISDHLITNQYNQYTWFEFCINKQFYKVGEMLYLQQSYHEQLGKYVHTTMCQLLRTDSGPLWGGYVLIYGYVVVLKIKYPSLHLRHTQLELIDMIFSNSDSCNLHVIDCYVRGADCLTVVFRG